MKSTTQKNEYVTDTMGLVIYLEKRRMPSRVKDIFVSAANGESNVFIPAMVFAEILYLAEKKRIEITLNDISALLAQTDGFAEQPLTWAIVEAAAKLEEIPELHDRLIAGTASHLGLPLITNDPLIHASLKVETLW